MNHGMKSGRTGRHVGIVIGHARVRGLFGVFFVFPTLLHTRLGRSGPRISSPFLWLRVALFGSGFRARWDRILLHDHCVGVRGGGVSDGGGGNEVAPR